MKKYLSVLSCCCLCCLVVLGLTVTSADAGTVCICHHPPGNPDNAHTICIGAPAVRAHMKHGDTMGECPVACDSADDCRTNQFCKRDDGVCAEDAIGVCTNRPASCPATITPVCGCDGTTYDNACLAAAAGAAVSHTGTCEVACTGNGDCGENQFCKRADGECAEDASGICADVPAACPLTVDPVCGCDGITYNNACEANGAGVNVASAGACQAAEACGGTAGGTCAVGEFCKRPDGACTEDAEGVCTTIPGVCPSTFIPVCGCDGVTYSNDCFAASNGASVSAPGACAEGAACGGEGGATCAEGEFCLPPVGECAAGAAGTCRTVPGACPLTSIPVCGCDGVTYSNPCSAASAGVAIDHGGECAADQQACGGAAGTCPEGEVCLRAVGECAADAEGICHPTPVACPGVIAPVCGCDGVTYSNACVAAGAGATVDHEGQCGEAEACDGETGVTCPASQFCKHADGECGVENEGACTDRPLTCEPVDSKVCACGGIGFPNACYANAVGLNVANTGVCAPPPEPVACDGATGVTCAASEFCKHADGACGVENEGVCTDRPLTCEPIDSKVCACGGIGFPNACYANAVGFNIANTGVCTP